MALSLSRGISDIITVHDMEFRLNLEFSNVLEWYELWKDDELSPETKLYIALAMILDLNCSSDDIDDHIELIKQIVPNDYMEDLLKEIIKRVAGEQTQSTTVKRDLKGNILEDEKSWYDFEEDADYIFSSFYMDYKIDLIESQEKKALHWDKFNALLSGLSEGTKFREVIKIRKMDIPEKATQDEKDEILEAKAAVALKSDRKQIEFDMLDNKQKREMFDNMSPEEQREFIAKQRG